MLEEMQPAQAKASESKQKNKKLNPSTSASKPNLLIKNEALMTIQEEKNENENDRQAQNQIKNLKMNNQEL